MNENQGKKLGKSDNQGAENQGNNLSQKKLKVKEVAVILGETDDVVRNWLKELEPYIPIEKNEKTGYRLFGEEAVARMRQIKQMHRVQGYTIRQIEAYLATGEIFSGNAPEAPDAVRIELAEVKELLHQQIEIQKELVRRLDQQQNYIDQALKAHDENLMRTLRTLQEAKQEAAAAKKKRGWLFWRKD
ncbi:MerR family transcriptional regulator [Paenibacillus ehimensis]|uniref:MerR family transcriptional regulator n=1 Tax=Paenibacillus ehimensis TaxID=79264 RepID=UPI000FDB36D6|nr:MerR family transcriptional regulator [Paenibacillus ehimensis]